MSDNPPSSDTQAPKRIDWLATTAGALAAVTSSLLLSTLGAVGTLVGAAIGSVAATIGTNLYSQWLAKSHQKVTSVQALARWRAAGLAGVRSESASESVAEAAADAGDEAAGAEPTPTWRERLEALPWKRVVLLSLAMFVVVVAVITVFELLAGRSVSSIVGDGDGDTTISRVTGGGSDARDEEPGREPSTGTTTTPEESASPTTEPSQEPQESESAVPEEPSEEPSTSTEPSATPSEQPSQSPSTSSEPSPSTGASSAPAAQPTS
ncbi:hypothetical protein G5C66_03370 [Nocardioides sp. KC13]|uniref:Uncharacterized protein n=1 Tax=Nocardioides turkmenicus TaxID=2711220 RepID=A0A6M1QVS0_9ACTN|nr:hypothetical protein [Nocardioides sp. KC13]NGN91780.1 hypothetical protein [Nocardioides sp. KC13]